MEIAKSKSIGEAFLRRAKASGNRVAFRYKQGGVWKEVSFAEQAQAVKRLSAGLMHQGVQKGDRVFILASTSIYWAQFDFAVLGCGAITVPVYPTNTPEDTAFILNHAEAGALFCDDYKNLQKLASISDKCPKLKTVIVNFDVKPGDIKAGFEILHWNKLYDLGLNQEAKYAAKFESNMADAKPEDVFTICYTSGTTGVPKGVVLQHSAMCSVMEDVAKVLIQEATNITEEEELLTFLPMSHIFGKWESMTPYFLGWTISFAESIDALVVNLAEVRPTLWVAVPRIFEKIYAKIMSQVDDGPAVKKKLFQWALEVGRENLDARTKGQAPSVKNSLEYALAKKLVFSKVSGRFGGRLKFCVSGSAPLAKNIAEFMHIVGVPVYEGYGLTETCAPVSVNLPGANKFGTVGKLLPEVLAKIADDGEILLKTKKNFKEYYKNSEATAEALKDGWFYTGDIGHLDQDGYLKITDRKKDLIKTAGGKFIVPQKIENLAKEQRILNQVVVYGDEKPYAVALLTLNKETAIQLAQNNKVLFSDFNELVKNPLIVNAVGQAVEQINSHLARYETLKKFVILPNEFTVEDGELTPSLKVKRKFLTKKYNAELEALYSE